MGDRCGGKAKGRRSHMECTWSSVMTKNMCSWGHQWGLGDPEGPATPATCLEPVRGTTSKGVGLLCSGSTKVASGDDMLFSSFSKTLVQSHRGCPWASGPGCTCAGVHTPSEHSPSGQHSRCFCPACSLSSLAWVRDGDRQVPRLTVRDPLSGCLLWGIGSSCDF